MWTKETAQEARATAAHEAVAIAEATCDAQNKFLGYICHEIRVPLNGVMMAAQELAEDPMLPPTGVDNVAIISTAGDAMSKLLNDCLNLAKIRSGKFDLELAPFPPRRLAESIISLFHFRDLSYSVRIAPDLPSAIMGDEGRLRQVLANFTSNAIKFSSSGGRIEIHVLKCAAHADPAIVVAGRLWDHDEMAGGDAGSSSPVVVASGKGETRNFVLYVVEDRGIGVARRDQEKLFQPFEQIQAGANQKGNGTGLGLSIAKHIVEQSGGRIGCWSKMGVGSRFWFTIPDCEEDAEVHLTVSTPNPRTVPSAEGVEGISCVTAEVPTHPTVDTSKSMYLSATAALSNYTGVSSECSSTPLRLFVVVDDTDSNRVLLARMLRRMGAASNVSMAADGVEALAHEEWLQADAWFVDRHMPRMDGAELCRVLRQRGYAGPIIGVTGDAGYEEKQSFIEAGATMVVTKPCSRASIEAALASSHLWS
jgi:signal transduction histidine kinase